MDIQHTQSPSGDEMGYYVMIWDEYVMIWSQVVRRFVLFHYVMFDIFMCVFFGGTQHTTSMMPINRHTGDADVVGVGAFNRKRIPTTVSNVRYI